MNWQEIAERHGTDKSTHGYMSYYGRHLGIVEPPESILEIGCEKGNSIRMWKEIYPDASLTALDLFQEHPVPDIPGVEFITGNQLDHEILYHLRNHRKFEVIIDDGSHNSRDQLVTFWSLIGTCRVYIVEDLHCCYDDSYRQGLPFEKTMLGQMKTGIFPYQHFLYEEKIAFIYR